MSDDEKFGGELKPGLVITPGDRRIVADEEVSPRDLVIYVEEYWRQNRSTWENLREACDGDDRQCVDRIVDVMRWSSGRDDMRAMDRPMTIREAAEFADHAAWTFVNGMPWGTGRP